MLSNEKLIKLGMVFVNKFLKAGLSFKHKKRIFDVDPMEFKMGIKVEFEHTSCPYISAKIAIDHLTEIPDYYTRLAKMENDAFKELGIHEDESDTNDIRISNSKLGAKKDEQS